MSRANPRSRHDLLYLGEISEPPPWTPTDAQSRIAELLRRTRAGMFLQENPSAEKINRLDKSAGQMDGVSFSFKAGESNLWICVGPADEPAAPEFGAAVERYSKKSFRLNLPSGVIELGERTKIMGILNVTPDSFSDGGRFHAFDAAVAQGERMAEEGADIIDVGGESTRPGSDPVPVDEEAERVVPVIAHLAKNLKVPISIDTCKAEIARRALDAGAEIINDVSALRVDEDMVAVARESGCPVILMHMLHTPKVMQQDPYYDALMPEVVCFLRERIDYLAEQGVNAEQVIVDPGIGFGKTVDHNLEILRELGRLRALGRPILSGPSRKSTIGKVLDLEVEDRIEGTAAAVALSVANGAHIVRVHDVKEMARVAKMTDAILGRGWN